MKFSVLLGILLFYASFSFSQCSNCGNGIVDAGETINNCPSDVSRNATCSVPTSAPGGSGSQTGIRIVEDFTTASTTLTSTGLPTGWTTSTGTDAFGQKQGLITPTGSSSTGNKICSITSTLGADFDGKANSSSHPSFFILRGTGSKFLASPAYNMSAVEGFKIQFWLAGSSSSCGGSFSSCSSAKAYLDFSSNGGSTWTQIMEMNSTGTSSDMCYTNTNAVWFKDGSFSRVCLTVFKSSTSSGNYYPNADANSAGSGMMVNSVYFTANFKYRIRLEGSCGTISTTNPGTYLAIDYPIITSGNEMIPCGLSFSNMCGYGLDDNDDGVGSSTATTLTTVFGTTKRGVNHSERGVEILTSQNALFVPVNTTGSTLGSDYIFGNAEGGDQQCINWQSSGGNSVTAVYEVVSDFKPATGGVQLKTYKNSSPVSINMTNVTASGKVPSIGWRYAALRFVNCSGSGSQDLNPGCNGYHFVTTSLPTSFGRTFYTLDINNSGKARSVYGATSCSNYFSGPTFAPIASPVDPFNDNSFVECSGDGLVFKANVDYCSPSMFTGVATYEINGPAGFSETITSGETSSAITEPGEYTITGQTPTTPTQCLDCSRSVCVTVSQAQIDNCIVPLFNDNYLFTGQWKSSHNYLNWQVDSDFNHSHFELERSFDGVYFEPIASIDHSTTKSTSGFVDFKDFNYQLGVNYYRLKVFDFNGKQIYSRVISVNASSIGVKVYPNPTKGIINVLELPDNAQVDVVDLSGKLIQQYIPSSKSLTIYLAENAGIYFINVRSEIGTETLKVVIE